MKKYNAEEWKAKQDEAKEKLKAQVADIVTNFENDPEDILEFLHFSSRFYQYSTNNKMLIYRRNPGARFCASYNKLKEMGYQVQQGQKGMEILVPAAVTYWYDDNISQWKRLFEAGKEEKAKIKAGEIETKKITVFKIGHTFDIGQTDCPVADYPKLFNMGYASEKHDKLFNAVKSYCEERGIPVYIDSFPSISMRGYFLPADNTIHLSDKLNDSMKLSVLTHELGHAVMHASYDPDMSSEQKEIEADSLSLMLREHLGVSEIENARKAHLADSYRNYLEYKELNSDRIKCPELPDILDRVNTAYGDMITGFSGAIENYLHRENEEIKELNFASTEETNNKKIANEITQSIGHPLPKEESIIDYKKSINRPLQNVNTELTKLVAAFEEAYNVPGDERLTVYSGDYMLYEMAEHASAENFNSAVSTALEKLELSETEFETAEYSEKQLVGFFKKIIENEKENEQFKSDLIKWQNGEYPATEVIKVCSTPYVMQACGIEAHDIVIKNNTLRKITSDDIKKFPHAHNMSIGELYQIPNAIRNPVMILKGNRPNSIIFVSDIYDSNNNRIIIPCTLNFDLKHYTAQRIMSIYGKENFKKYIKKEIEKKSLIAYNKKIANELTQSIGLYLPLEESLIDYDNSICYYPQKVNTEKEKRLIKDLKQMILRDETSPEAVLSDRSAQNWYSFACQASNTDEVKSGLKRLVADDMKVVAVQDFDAGSKAVQLTPDFQLQFIGSGYSNHREALSAVLGDSAVAKIVEYDTLKNTAENRDFKIITEAENIKYPYVIFENSNSEIRRMPIRDALKELEEKNNVAIEKQSYEAVDISIVADRDNVYSMQAELGTPRSVTEQIQAYCDDLKRDGLGREAALQKYINGNHTIEMNFSARNQIMFDGFDIGR
jgi:hypothetical protein